MLFEIKNYRYYSDTYCETGAAYGESIKRALEAGFSRVLSVEIHEPFYRYCTKRYPGVEIYLGKSTEQLPTMLSTISKPSVFFLDAHPAGPGTGGHDELKSGNQEFLQDNIIEQEVKHILSHHKEHLVIIDDVPKIGAYEYLFPDNYQFTYLDQQLAPNEPLFKDKIVVCKPA